LVKNMMQRFLGIVSLVSTLGLACSGDDGTPTDPPPEVQPAISVGDQTVAEGNTVLFGISLDQSTTHAVTFTFSTANGTALAGSDYYAASGSDTIAAGQISTTVLVPTIDDLDVETAETFTLILNSVTGASVANSTATATINDNDISGVRYSTQVQPLLRTSCAKLGFCHGGSLPGGGVFLDTTASYDNVISATGSIITGGLVVIPGNSAASTLYTQTTDDYSPAISRMPKGFPALSPAQQQLIRDWIDQGAQDN